tara:strand:+ start:772 stop:2088 length:1317 start_codon:yes stop_codon:yes gene_type:complete
MNEIALPLNLSDLVREFNTKLENSPSIIDGLNTAWDNLQKGCNVGGAFGYSNFKKFDVSLSEIKQSLLKSSWRKTYELLNIATITSANDRKLWEQSLNNPIDFTPQNIIASFGQYLENPRANILRGLAEVFMNLDPAYKSHEKVKIGVKGLPKRLILSGFNSYSSWGRERITDILNALALYQGKPLLHYAEINNLIDNGFLQNKYMIGGIEYPSRGVWLKRFSNGNGHLFFEPDTLRDINKALAEYYGDVLPDESGEKPTAKQASTAVSKDLQYYPTPKKIVDEIIRKYNFKDKLVLEPSCGCGRIMDGLHKEGAIVGGIEFDATRANIARSKGHNVQIANFLETVPTGKCDFVVMNPPFYGKHYAKHVEHAFKFLKDGGKLIAILPSTARYDHGLINSMFNIKTESSERYHWDDLACGSFKESGTNISISIFTVSKN